MVLVQKVQCLRNGVGGVVGVAIERTLGFAVCHSVLEVKARAMEGTDQGNAANVEVSTCFASGVGNVA